MKQPKNGAKVVVLDNIRSVFNVGSIFRTADALGIDQIYLCGCTPTPTDRFGRARRDLAKVALGAEKNIPWVYAEQTGAVLKMLKRDGYYIVAIEQDKKSISIKNVQKKYPIAFVLGSEVDGMSASVRAYADVIAEIPMAGKKESLNVSVSFGIAGYSIIG